MKSLLFSIDYVYKQDGTLTPVELNTNTGTEFGQGAITQENFLEITDGFYDHAGLHTYLQSSSIQNIKTIAIPGSEAFFEQFALHYGYTYENIATQYNQVTVPDVEDSDDTLIIRIAYDTYSIIDDTYARDNFEFLNLIKSESFASKVTFVQEGLDTIDSFELSQDGLAPNYVVKHRTPGYTQSEYPKLYKFSSLAELDNLKNSLQDSEYIQKFEFSTSSSFIDDRIIHLRSLNLVIGGDLGTVLNISNYVSPNRLAKTNSLLTDPTPIDSNKLLSPVESSKYYPTFYIRRGFVYHHDENDIVLGNDGSLIDFENLNIETEVSDIVLSENITKGSTGTLSDLNNFSISGSSVFAISSRTEGGIFVNITATSEEFGEFSWYDGIDNKYLTQPDVNSDSISYITGGEIEVGDRIFFYDKDTNLIKPLTVTSIGFDFKNINTYKLTL